jgi:hypothetical protein
MVFRYRGYLPHLESPGSIYFVTLRLAGSLPMAVLEGFKAERKQIQAQAEQQQQRKLSKYDHVVRTEGEFSHYVGYTLDNPVKARLCNKWNEWRWSGCSEEIRSKLEPLAGETPALQ